MLFQENIPMKEYTSLKIGGRARWFSSPNNKEELKKVLSFATTMDIPIFILGSGTNTLIKDEGVKGMVIKLGGDFKNVEIQNQEVKAGAGCLLSSLITQVSGFSLSGIETLYGIPGTVGGAVFGNAGCFGVQISDYVKAVTVMGNDGTEQIVKDVNFFYRGSSLKDKIILDVLFSLKKDVKWRIEEKINEALKKRSTAQPVSAKTAGCIFKNPEGKFAGELIEKAGFKGRSVGDAVISTKHANFIENRGSATSEDVISLINMVKRRVWELYGVMLYEEIVIIN
ncbi:TPA: UDP-N-acetylenolpyruvoylglucosamine reductase [bacterium]|nr:UDP-N-acetylenolpyruvoylglucosamine reductase [bacterium]